MNSKKFILFIVEGPNDDKEINAILRTPRFQPLLQKYVPWFIRTKGDITSNKKIKSARGELNELVNEFRQRKGPYPGIKTYDIQEVVQITDLDGTFIPPENIYKGEELEYKYTDNGIITKDFCNAIGRNKQKADRIRQLVFETNQIDNIPFSIYFVSCDMEHVLFDQRKPTEIEKKQLCQSFMDLCKNHPEILEESVFKKGIAAEGSYEESWEYIMQPGLLSLLRHTNMNLFFGDGAKNPK